MSRHRAVFFDRDGVLNETILANGKPMAPLTLEEFRLVPGIGAEVTRLRGQGFLSIVFTNQPEIARGLLMPEILETMHERLRHETHVDDIYVCPHIESDGCDCHKPRTGMLTAAARKWSIDLSKSYVVGDRWRDVEAGRAVGAYSILIERPYSACLTADANVPDLRSAVDRILSQVEAIR